MKNWAVITIIGIIVIALAVSFTMNITEVGKIKNNNAEIASQQAEIAKVEAPRHFNSLDELQTWLQQAAVNTKYAALRPIERAYILQVLALRDGYLLPAGFEIGATAFDAFNTAYISGTIYMVSPSTNAVTNLGPNDTPFVVNPISSQPLPFP
jgi:hypothetical protein